MIKLLKQQEYILALKSQDELYFGAHITKKERQRIVDRIKYETKIEKKAAKLE